MFQPGDVVIRRNKREERGTIISGPKQRAGMHIFKVLFPSSAHPVEADGEDLEKVKLAATIEDRLYEGEFGRKATFSRLLTYERLQRPLQDTLYSLRATKTQFQPYQFKPLLKFLRSGNQRLLLADEVGLGKTIEAGFILCEMLARHRETFRRALIVCKASLRIKWQMEMRNRFDRKFHIWRATDLRNFLDEHQRDPEQEMQAICSLESFRDKRVAQRWEAMPPQLDLLIIDEAHHLKNSETQIHRACRNAAEAADAVLALTATPIQIGSRDLFNILSLLDEGEFGSYPYFESCMLINRWIVMAERLITQSDPGRFQAINEILQRLGNGDQTLIREAMSRAQVQSSQMEIFSAAEAVIQRIRENPVYDETLRMLEHGDPYDKFVTVGIQRNLAELNFLSRVYSRTRRRDVHIGTQRVAQVLTVEMSEAERGFYRAVTDYVRQRYRAEGKDSALLFGLMMPQRQVASCIPAMVNYYASELGAFPESDSDSDDERTDTEAESFPKSSDDGQAAHGEELRRLILRWYRDKQPDSKLNALLACLENLQATQPGEPVVIFSYFKKTLEYLSGQLHAKGYSNTVISGSFTPEEREERIQSFRDGKHQILLSSEVGSEGLDFQFCHIIVNYDLPWNPMLVEQRIGRLDRFGQEAEKILIFNLSAPGTIEDEILDRLYRRIELFESYIGDLEAILGEEISTLTKDLFDPDLTDEQRRQKIDDTARILASRRLQYEEWEKASPQFVGHDEYYQQEVSRAQDLGRFIDGRDLAVFVEDFLKHLDKRGEFTEVEPDVYQIESDRLLRFLIAQPEDPEKFEVMRRLQGQNLRITFHANRAVRDVLFVHVRHYLIRAIVNEYRREEDRFQPVAQMNLTRSENLPATHYLYALYRATIRSARDQDILFPILIDLRDCRELEEDASEIILGRMLKEGKDGDLLGFDHSVLENAFEKAQDTMAGRFQIRKNDAIRLNDSFIRARLTSLRESYRIKIARKRALLENARQKQQQLSYIRMLEGTIRNLEAGLEAREKEIEKKRDVTAEYRLIAAGLLHVS